MPLLTRPINALGCVLFVLTTLLAPALVAGSEPYRSDPDVEFDSLSGDRTEVQDGNTEREWQ